MAWKFAALALCLGLIACGGPPAEKKTDSAVPDFSITTNKDGVAGTMTGGAAADWPADAPAFLPAYPGAAVNTGMRAADGDKLSVTVSFETADPVDKVMNFYVDKIKAAGIATTSMMDMGETKMFSGQTEDGGVFQVMVMPQDGKTRGTVIFGKS